MLLDSTNVFSQSKAKAQVTLEQAHQEQEELVCQAYEQVKQQFHMLGKYQSYIDQCQYHDKESHVWDGNNIHWQ